jgi:hypothetical protein
MTRKELIKFIVHWGPILATIIVAAPFWLFLIRLWWEATRVLLTEPWDQIFCIGNQCLS